MAPTTRRSNRARVARPSVRLPIPKDKLVELSPKHNKTCMFCGRKEISEMLYGAVQKGADEEGIWGFLLKDIKAEITRGSREPCFYCQELGATISCCGLKCKKKFHLPCGLRNGSMHQFFSAFKSYCSQHRVTQTVDLKDLQSSTPIECSICKEDVFANPMPGSIWAPCCKRNAWFHRKCIQQLALSAGYFFKCPLCNNNETFKNRMLHLGIYIPSRDASWETEPDAYSELLERHNSCNIELCLCPFPQKRLFKQETGSWEIVLCHTCGSNGTHVLCSSLKCDEQWICKSCSTITDSVHAKRRRLELNNGVSNSQQDDSRSLSLDFNNSSLRRTSTRGVSRSNGIIESAGLNTNKERIQTTIKPQTIIDSIVISDDESDDHDSDIECITYVEPPRMDIPLPRIMNCQSIAVTMSTNINRYPFRAASSSRQARNISLIVSESIDLTNSDDEN